MSEPATITASLKYLRRPTHNDRLHLYVTKPPGPDERASNFEYEDHDVQIENLCGKESEVTLDNHGSQFFRHPAKHREFRVNEDTQKEYYLESEHLIKELTDASRVVFFDHTVRRRNPAANGRDPQNRQPAAAVHVDQTTCLDSSSPSSSSGSRCSQIA
ncbi:hypothetical protein PUNSTDRAFT_135628 [Punctularia strigosozonata HHB-11173 SS5]|uniref:uncharacterized protein n=1 Tax=Punctularia strigosozonata (strain HHB-11173) TaxID=741275 RepID=UPI000441736A|nr:uncharacterized protein PUNSTDRAFT_135628 [Punctularia strigosozonata HHB-11173 SS5]EIN08115.1 hypothetical protein PUNSTDRAFT_135628 [Punctularia strigosozonata HHB-11173 SS5]